MYFSAFPFTHPVRHNCALFLDFPIFFHIFLNLDNLETFRTESRSEQKRKFKKILELFELMKFFYMNM